MMLSARKAPLLLMLMAAVMALSALFAACGGGDDEGSNGDAGDGGEGGNGSPGTMEISMGDNFYEFDGERNPTLIIPGGSPVTMNLTNSGTAIHNIRIAGEDNKYDNADDAVSDPTLVSPGGTATLKWTAPDEAGTFDYRCDFHPTDMLGKITVE